MGDINLERKELRYIYYNNDEHAIIKRFEDLGFEKEFFAESPTTLTVYFGTKNGLEPGLSIKARIYTPIPIQNSWNMTSDIQFNLLEIKSSLETVEVNDLEEPVEEEGLIISMRDVDSDIMFRIQSVSEDALNRSSDVKVKSRLHGGDLSSPEGLSNFSLQNIVKLLNTKSELDELLSPSLVEILENQIRPKYKDNSLPILLTQYNRVHLVPKDERIKNLIRVTIDPGVQYYELLIEDKVKFQTDPNCMAEIVEREPFGRIEFKMSKKFKKEKELYKNVRHILSDFGCVAFLSKKWRGITIISDKYISNQEFWKEPLDSEISGFFPVDSSWFEYGVVMKYLNLLIEESHSFSTHYKQWPRLLVKNQNYVSGYIGVPVPSLITHAEGADISYHLPSSSYPVKLSNDGPDFFITEEHTVPVKATTVSSKEEIDRILHKTIEIEGHVYFRSFGLLVKSDKSERIYKLTIERKRELKKDEKQTRIYCKMRYIGTSQYLYKVNKQSIYDDLKLFYEEFSTIMQQDVEDYFQSRAL